MLKYSSKNGRIRWEQEDREGDGMTTRDLEIFVTVAEYGNMSEAAKKLYIAPSSISQTILDIEKEYNTILFVRKNKRLYITEKGEMLLGYAHHLLALNDEIEHRMREDIQSCIYIGATPSIGSAVAGDIIHEYQKEYPHVMVELIILHSGETQYRLRRGELDLGLIIHGRSIVADLTAVPMVTDQVLLACGRDHPFASRTTILPEELNGQPFILRQRGSQMREFYDKLIRTYDLRPKELWTTSDAVAQKNAVIAGHGLALLSNCMAGQDRKEGRLHLLEVSGMNFSRNFELVYHKSKFINPDLRSFINACQDYRKKLE